jgi:hypothetical protein
MIRYLRFATLTGLLLLASTIPAAAQLMTVTPSTITTNAGVACVSVDKTIAAVTFTITGTWTGTLAPKMQHTTASTYTTPVSGHSVASVTSNGSVTVTNYGARRICMQATATMTGTATVSAVAGGAGLASITGGGDASAANQVTLNGLVDQLEGYLDQLEGYVDGLEGFVDGVETKIDATNTAIASTNTKLDTAAANDVSDNTTDTGNAVKIGGVAKSMGTTPTSVGNDTRRSAMFTRGGSMFTLGGAPNVITRECSVADSDNAQTGTACVTVSTGSKIVVTRATVTCNAANTVNVAVRVMFDTDSTFASAATTGVSGGILSHPGVPPGGGANVGDGSGVIGVGADDEDVRFTMADPVTGSCTLSVSYFTVTG